MWCFQCGQEVSNEAKFCPKCGADLQKTGNEKEKHKADEKKRKLGKVNHTIYIIGIATVIVILSGVFFLFLQSEKSDRFINMLKEGDITGANAYYQSELVGDEKELQKVYETVTAEIELLVDSYYADSLSYDDALNGLKVYSEFYATETNKAIHEIEILKKSREAFTSAEGKYATEEYYEAYRLFGEVIEEDSNFEAAQKGLEKCYVIIKDKVFANSNTAAEEGDFLSAIEILKQEISFLKEEDKQNADSRIAAYTQEYLDMQTAVFDAYLENSEYDECFELLETLKNEAISEDELTDLTQKLCKLYENYITEQYNAELEKRDLSACMQWIRRGEEKIPESEVFAGLETELQEYYPVSLYEMEPFAIGDSSLGLESSKEDTLGIVRSNVIRGYMDADDNQFNIYYIDGKFNTLTGTVAVSKGSIGSKKIGYIKIYGDDLLLWEDTNIDALTEPYEISVDISGVRQLKLEMCGPGNMGFNGISVMLCDPILQK